MLETLLQSTPFIFYSDHDTQGAQIFANLKYGSILLSYVIDYSIRCNLERMGILSTELTLQKEIDLMLAGTGVCHFLYLQHASANRLYQKFHLALLSDGNHSGIERFIA